MDEDISFDEALERLQAGDAGAFEALLAEHWPRVQRGLRPAAEVVCCAGRARQRRLSDGFPALVATAR